MFNPQLLFNNLCFFESNLHQHQTNLKINLKIDIVYMVLIFLQAYMRNNKMLLVFKNNQLISQQRLLG